MDHRDRNCQRLAQSPKGPATLIANPYVWADAAASAIVFVAGMTWIPPWLMPFLRGPLEWFLTEFFFYPVITLGILKNNAKVIDDLTDARQREYLEVRAMVMALEGKKDVSRDELLALANRYADAIRNFHSNRKPDGLLDTKQS